MYKRKDGFRILSDRADALIKEVIEEDIQPDVQIRGRWCYLLDNISPTTLVQNLKEQNFWNAEIFNDDKYTDRRSRTLAILFNVYRKLTGGNKACFPIFKRCLEKSERLFQGYFDVPVPKANFMWSVYADQVEGYKKSLEENRSHIIPALSKEDSIIGIGCVLFECFIFEFEDLENLCFTIKRCSETQAAEELIDKVISCANKGSFHCFINAWEKISTFKQTELISSMKKSAKEQSDHVLWCRKQWIAQDACNDVFKKITVRIEVMDDHFNTVHRQMKQNINCIIPDFIHKCFVFPSKIEDGSVVLHLVSPNGVVIERIRQFIKDEGLTEALEKLFNNNEVKATLKDGNATIKVTIQATDVDKDDGQPTTSLHNVYLETPISSNLTFLEEEIDTTSLLNAFRKKHIHGLSPPLYLDNNRRSRSRHVLKQIEARNLLPDFKQILQDEEMFFVLERMQTYDRIMNADPKVVRQNIIIHFIEITEKADCDEIIDIFRERQLFDFSFIKSVEVVFQHNIQEAIVTLLVAIIKAGNRVILNLVDALYITKQRQLADKLLSTENYSYFERPPDIAIRQNHSSATAYNLFLGFFEVKKIQDPYSTSDINKEYQRQKRNQIQQTILQLGELENCLLKWISQTNTIIEELRKLATDLNEHFRKINIAKVSGSVGAIIGGVLTAVGLVLIPFTFGGSVGLSIAGGIAAGAGGITVGGSMAADAVLSGNRRKEAEALLEQHAICTKDVKDKCISISTILRQRGKIEECFPEWVAFWANVVGCSEVDQKVEWSKIIEILKSELKISSATLRGGLAAGAAAARIGSAAAGAGLHIAGGVIGLLFVPLDIYILVDSALDIHKKNPHKVAANIESLVDNLEKQCPRNKDVIEMIKHTKCHLI